MKDVNKVILVGRLGADPTLRETKNGISVTDFPLATSHRTRGAEGAEPKEETQWHRIVAWGKQAEICTEFLKKGRLIFVEGYIRSRKYTDKEGIERYSFEVHADSISFLDSPGQRPQVGLDPRSA